MRPDLIEQLRTIGLPMTASYANGWRLAWTTDAAKADAAREAGATVTGYRSRDERFTGWEVSARDTTEADTG